MVNKQCGVGVSPPCTHQLRHSSMSFYPCLGFLQFEVWIGRCIDGRCAEIRMQKASDWEYHNRVVIRMRLRKRLFGSLYMIRFDASLYIISFGASLYYHASLYIMRFGASRYYHASLYIIRFDASLYYHASLYIMRFRRSIYIMRLVHDYISCIIIHHAIWWITIYIMRLVHHYIIMHQYRSCYFVHH